MKVIVTGSLGHISQPLATALAKNGHSVTIISSKSEKTKEIEDLGASAAIGSVDDVDFLASVFAGADVVYAMVPPNYAAPDARAYYRQIGDNYAQAIKQAGVGRVVYLSSYGAHLDKDTGVILGAHEVEGLLGQLPDVAVTFLRPGYFYYNLYGFVDTIKKMGVIAANYGGDDRIVMVDPKDIAAAAVEEIETPAPNGTVRYVVSDERTADEVAQVLGAAIGKPDLKWVTVSDEDAQKGMEGQGLPPQIAASLTELGTAIHRGILNGDYDLHKPDVMGKVKLEDFAREFAAAFNR